MSVLALLRRLVIIAAIAAAVTAAVKARRNQSTSGPTANHDSPHVWPPLETAAASTTVAATTSVAATTGAATNADSESWVEPVDGACPTSHPIKAKTASGIYHQPGGRSYDRTRADRCYGTAEAAEADGFRPARA